MKNIFMPLILAAVICMFPFTAEAELHDRGGGLIYDDVQDITWLQDANYVDTSGYDDAVWGFDTGGLLEWVGGKSARTWASNLEYYDPARNVTWDDWRLPSADPDCGDTSWDCSTSEMGHLYLEDGITPATPGDFKNLGPFDDWLSSRYWTGTSKPGDYGDSVWVFYFDDGRQSWTRNFYEGHAWAVRDGDVGPVVPEPLSCVLFITGGATLGIRKYFR